MRSWIFLFLCNLMWALQFTCIKLVQDQVGSLFTVWGPMTLATLMLWPLVRAERKRAPARAPRPRSDIWLYLLLAGVGVFPGQVLITWGTRMSTASNAAIIMLSIPVCTAVFAFLFLGERMNMVRWLSFAVAIVGVLLCSRGDISGMDMSAGFLAGNALIMAGTLGSAFYNSYGKKALERYSPMEMLFFTYLGMMVLLTPLVVAQEADVLMRVTSFTAKTWLGLALLTFFHNYLSMVLFLTALKELDATQAALSNYLVTFLGVPIAAIWLGERLSTAAMVGGGLVLASTLLITLWNPKPKATETS
ncbi:MAG TPA: DMT family transporter [Bryobacteraceae bacterium]|nr:DMT family transporter [Bryobacteraceae bacterium]